MKVFSQEFKEGQPGYVSRKLKDVWGDDISSFYSFLDAIVDVYPEEKQCALYGLSMLLPTLWGNLDEIYNIVFQGNCIQHSKKLIYQEMLGAQIVGWMSVAHRLTLKLREQIQSFYICISVIIYFCNNLLAPQTLRR